MKVFLTKVLGSGGVISKDLIMLNKSWWSLSSTLNLDQICSPELELLIQVFYFTDLQAMEKLYWRKLLRQNVIANFLVFQHPVWYLNGWEKVKNYLKLYLLLLERKHHPWFFLMKSILFCLKEQDLGSMRLQDVWKQNFLFKLMVLEVEQMVINLKF